MESWNHIVHTALLGTDKKQLRKEDVDAAIADSFDLVAQQTAEKEDLFLQTAALVYNYRQCGFLPLKKETVVLPQAAEEEKAYAAVAAHVALQDIVAAGSASLLLFWLEGCAAAQKIVQPEVIPALLDAGVKSKALRSLVKSCCGRRGEWLVQFNAGWKWNQEMTDDQELWQTGTLAQRATVLAQVRAVDPAKGRELLQQTWAQEPAAGKVELIEQLLINAGDDDVVWLEELPNEKSIKVKEAVLNVLKTIPSSAIVQTYWSVLKQSIRLTVSKGLLGIGSKQKLEVKLAGVDEAIFKTGVQQLPSEKGANEEQFILYQLTGFVPPVFWEHYFNLDKREVIKLFLKEVETKALLPAVGSAAARFTDVDWMRAVIAADENKIHLDALRLLPQNEAEVYAIRFFSTGVGASSVLQAIHNFSAAWSLPFTKEVLQFTARNVYQYHRGFYNDIAHLMPVAIIAELESFAPKEEALQTMWKNVSDHLTKLLTLKQQTLNAFSE